MRDEQVFNQVLEQAVDQRAAFLDVACGTDVDLRERVAVLLRAQANPGSFLQFPACGVGNAPTIDQPLLEMAGTQIGPYKLIEEIGQGGMGVVYMAEQKQPVRRRVALKIIKPGMDSRQVIARFDAERQTLAIMDHPNIARIIDAGTTEQGRPYFVMELVHGIPINEFCDQKRLTVRERLQLFLQVCQAVQHAHQKGIIHRDLKPTNVLVTLLDVLAVPKVIDFGIAKAFGPQLTDHTQVTGFAQIVGTPLYMSPEQAEMNPLGVDTRSDVYSLGVMLYELLTGKTPFESETLRQEGPDEMRRMIREVDPPQPSVRISTLAAEVLSTVSERRRVDPRKLSQLFRGELDWIVMKALEKDRNRRYETANALAADVQRYLDDLPVQASPPSTLYRLRKFARRNRAGVFAASIAVVALLAGTTVSTWQAVVANRAKEIAQSREAETRAVLDFVENKVFSAARPEGEEGGLGYDVTLRQAVEAALPFVAESFTAQPLVEARLRLALGTSFQHLGEDKVAAEQLEAARTILTKHQGPAHADTLQSMHKLASSYNNLGRLTDALQLHEETLAKRRAKLGAEHPDTLKSMASLAKTYSSLGRNADALKLDEETLAIRKAKLGPEHSDTLSSMMSVGNCYAELGQHTDALKLREETLALCKTKVGPEHPSTIRNMNNLAQTYYSLGRFPDSLKLREETLVLMKAKLGAEHPDTLLRGMPNLAQSYSKVGREADELPLREEIHASIKAKFGPDHPDLIRNGLDLAVSYTRIGRHADALKLREETLKLARVVLGTDDPNRLWAMEDLAQSYAIIGRSLEGLELREETLALRRVHLGPEDVDSIRSMILLAGSYTDVGRHADALKLHEEVFALPKSKIVPERAFAIAGMCNLVINYHNLHRYEDARKLGEETLALAKGKYGVKSQVVDICQVNLARTYNALGRYSDALPLNVELLAKRKATCGPEHSGTLPARHNLAMTYYHLGRYENALQLNDETIALRKVQLGVAHADTLSVMRNQWIVYQHVGRHADALRLCEEILAISKANIGATHPDALRFIDDLAWMLATSPDTEVRNPGRAVELANEGVQLRPMHEESWRTLGVAQYRCGDYQAAITSLEKGIELRRESTSIEAFFLALALCQLNQKVQAREWYDKGVELMDQEKPKDGIEELPGFRAEASELLGIERGPQAIAIEK